MAHRPIKAKQVAKLRKAFRQTPETFINPVQYLKDRRFARTSGEAREIILAGRLKSESHSVGILKGEVDTVALVPAKLRSTLTVVSA